MVEGVRENSSPDASKKEGGGKGKEEMKEGKEGEERKEERKMKEGRQKE